MSEKIKFVGSIEKVVTDRDGYSRVTVEIPSNHLVAVLKLIAETGKALIFEVKEGLEEWPKEWITRVMMISFLTIAG